MGHPPYNLAYDVLGSIFIFYTVHITLLDIYDAIIIGNDEVCNLLPTKKMGILEWCDRIFKWKFNRTMFFGIGFPHLHKLKIAYDDIH